MKKREKMKIIFKNEGAFDEFALKYLKYFMREKILKKSRKGIDKRHFIC